MYNFWILLLSLLGNYSFCNRGIFFEPASFVEICMPQEEKKDIMAGLGLRIDTGSNFANDISVGAMAMISFVGGNIAPSQLYKLEDLLEMGFPPSNSPGNPIDFNKVGRLGAMIDNIYPFSVFKDSKFSIRKCCFLFNIQSSTFDSSHFRDVMRCHIYLGVYNRRVSTDGVEGIDVEKVGSEKIDDIAGFFEKLSVGDVNKPHMQIKLPRDSKVHLSKVKVHRFEGFEKMYGVFGIGVSKETTIENIRLCSSVNCLISFVNLYNSISGRTDIFSLFGGGGTDKSNVSFYYSFPKIEYGETVDNKLSSSPMLCKLFADCKIYVTSVYAYNFSFILSVASDIFFRDLNNVHDLFLYSGAEDKLDQLKKLDMTNAVFVNEMYFTVGFGVEGIY